MQKVLEQYKRHLSRLRTKMLSALAIGNTTTSAQHKGIEYYTTAAERVQAIVDAPTPEGD
jgi:hypothetical protein